MNVGYMTKYIVNSRVLVYDCTSKVLCNVH